MAVLFESNALLRICCGVHLSRVLEFKNGAFCRGAPPAEGRLNGCMVQSLGEPSMHNTQ